MAGRTGDGSGSQTGGKAGGKAGSRTGGAKARATPRGPSAEATATPGAQPATHPGERIAKVIARSGRASRRDAERLIAEGAVRVNGKLIDSPALNVLPSDIITVSGAALAAPEPARLWLYHKPAGLVTTARDEEGRPTVFDNLPEGMPRVVSVGRLDLNSEGLLLLTNDGGLKRRLELPATGWLRKYRVRVKGTPDEASLDPLRRGITVEGEHFQPMQVTIDRQQGANAWLTIGLREGRNREIRRALNAVGLIVNRLIRISFGPFRLGELPEGAVEEVRARMLRDQLGPEFAAAEAPLKTAQRVRSRTADTPPQKTTKKASEKAPNPTRDPARPPRPRRPRPDGR